MPLKWEHDPDPDDEGSFSIAFIGMDITPADERTELQYATFRFMIGHAFPPDLPDADSRTELAVSVETSDKADANALFREAYARLIDGFRQMTAQLEAGIRQFEN